MHISKMVAPQRPSRVRPAGTYSRRCHVLGHRPGHSWVPGSRSWVAVYRPASAGCEASQKKAGIKSNDAPSLGGTGTGEVDPAGQPALADGSAIAPSSRAVEVPVQVPLNETRPQTVLGTMTSRSNSARTRSLCASYSCSPGAAPARQETEVADFYLDHLLAVHLAVERVWQTRKTDLPTETGLKQKAYAWLANDLVRDKIVPSVGGGREARGKAMQTRVGALRGEVRSLRDRSGADKPDYCDFPPCNFTEKHPSLDLSSQTRSRQKRMAFLRSSLSLLGGAQAAARPPPEGKLARCTGLGMVPPAPFPPSAAR